MRTEIANLERATAEFVAAVKAGDKDRARALFGPTRQYYEKVEPVAGVVQRPRPKIDMRWDDTGDGAEDFTGFHRIERYLWPPKAEQIGDAEGKGDRSRRRSREEERHPEAIAKTADQLLTDVRALKAEVDKPDFNFDTQLFVNGPKALIDEVAKTKIAGEEDRYSHTDLWDFAANVEGGQRLIGELQPIIEKKDPALMAEITKQFEAITASIDKLRTPGATSPTRRSTRRPASRCQRRSTRFRQPCRRSLPPSSAAKGWGRLACPARSILSR